MAAPGGVGDGHPRPDAGDILLVIHDFKARSSDELSLSKGDRVELLERDDEFGDGWFLGKHLINGNTGLFPEVYTRPAPKGILGTASAPPPPAYDAATSGAKQQIPDAIPVAAPGVTAVPGPSSIPVDVKAASTPALQNTTEPTPIPLPLSSFKPSSASASSTPPSTAKGLSSPPSSFSAGMGGVGLNSSQENQVLSETLNVINEHITDMRAPAHNGPSPPITTDSGSEYSSHMDHRMSYIQGEETDEEEEGRHSRTEVESWNADQVAEFLFTAGVEKHHCEVFRDQDITGEVLLGMDQTSLFIKAFDLGSVGRRLKTWQKIKSLQDEVGGNAAGGSRRTTGNYGSDAGSDVGRRTSKGRSRTNTLTNSVQALPPIHDRPVSAQTKRSSAANTPRMDAHPVSPVSPAKYPGGSPTRPGHDKRPSAASIRDMHHSRRHSSTDFRLTGSVPTSIKGTPKLASHGTFPEQPGQASASTLATNHKKQPSFDRGWTLGGAAAAGTRPLSSTQDDMESDFNKAIADLDRGYFSGTEVDGRKRNVLKKRDSVQGSHSRGASYAEEQRVRAGTAMARHSRFGSVDFDSSRDPTGPSSAAHKYYGIGSPHRRTTSAQTTESIRPALPPKDNPSPTVTKLDTVSPVSPVSPVNRQGMHGDWFSKSTFKPGSGGLGLRAISDAVTGNERSKAISPIDSPNLAKDSPIQSPSRTGSSTPSAGPSFELDSPDGKSPSTTMTTVSARNPSKKKGKKETSAYQRGLQKQSPRDAMLSADYSGWMWKKSSNLMTTWKKRLFVLKGRRLAYYYSEDDQQEQGLIDISFHRVLPADNERLTGLHATLTGAFNSPATPADSKMPTLAETEANADPTKESEATFIFKLVPPRAGLSRAVNFTKPTVHYFAVPNIKQGRLWMAALMKATIERDDATPITTSYQQKTISLTKARQMRHRPPALMGLDETIEDSVVGEPSKDETAAKKDANGLGIVYNENDSGISGVEKLGFQKVESARVGQFPVMGAADADEKMPLSA